MQCVKLYPVFFYRVWSDLVRYDINENEVQFPVVIFRTKIKNEMYIWF